MARKNYPFNKRIDKKMTNLVSGLLTGLILAPFAAVDSLPVSNNMHNDDVSSKPVSKPIAVIFIIIGIALTPLFIPFISLAFQCFKFPIIGVIAFFALMFIPVIIWGGILYIVIESFIYKKEVNHSKSKQHQKSKYDKLIDTINNDVSIIKYEEIRAAYYNTINYNKTIKQKIEILNKEIISSRKRSSAINCYYL